MGAVSLLANVVVALVLAWIGRKIQRIEKLEEALTAKAEEMIAARFDALADKCAMKHATVNGELARIDRRLENGDAAFGELNHGATEFRVKLVQAVSDLRDFVHESCARREDVEGLKKSIAELIGRFGGLQTAVAREMAEKPVRVRT
jgi:hypothetical protein